MDVAYTTEISTLRIPILTQESNRDYNNWYYSVSI